MLTACRPTVDSNRNAASTGTFKVAAFYNVSDGLADNGCAIALSVSHIAKC